MTSKYINLDNTGNFIEKSAAVTSTGAGQDAIVATDPVTGKLDSSMLPSGIGSDNVSVICSESLSAGDLVNLYNNGGTLNARKADNTAANQGKTADGYVKSAYSASATAVVYIDVGTLNSNLTGLVVGSLYFLAATGGVTATRPTTSGHTVQKVGKAVSTTTLVFRPESAVALV